MSKNRKQIVDLYNSGCSVIEISRKVGTHRATVYNNLHAAGIELRVQKPAGSPRREVCGRGVHSFVDEQGNQSENVGVQPNGKRYCIPCAQFRWTMRHYMDQNA